jgi:hypothetical protein
MSAALSPMQQAVLREMGFTLYVERTAQVSAIAVQTDVLIAKSDLSSSVVLSTETPQWFEKLQRYISADQLAQISIHALPPNPTKAKREVWQQLRALMRRRG